MTNASAGDQSPGISVVIPTYNRPQLLHRALQSVDRQTYRDFEILVVDDCSPEPDSLAEIVGRFAHARLIRLEQNRGAPAARNAGIRQARGEFIALLDDDDGWTPTKLQTQIAVLQAAGPETGLCYTWADGLALCAASSHAPWAAGGHAEPDQRIVHQWRQTRQGNVLDTLLEENFIPSSSVFIRRAVFERVGLFDESFPSCQDWEMWVRIARDYQIVCAPQTLTVIHQHSAARVGLSPRALEGYERFVGKFSSLYGKCDRRLARHLEFIGYSYLRRGDYARGARRLQESLRVRPWSWKGWVKWGWAAGATHYARISSVFRRAPSGGV